MFLTELGIVSMVGGLGCTLWVLPPLAIIYVIARWRQERSGQSDPQLGWKMVLYSFLFVGFQLMLVGLALTVYALLAGDEAAVLRTGLALATSGGLIALAHVFVISQTNHVTFPLLGRMFSGINLLVIGLIATVALVAMTINQFQESASSDLTKAAGAGMAVYLASWLGCGYRHQRRFHA